MDLATSFAWLFTALAVIGMGQAVAGWWLVRRLVGGQDWRIGTGFRAISHSTVSETDPIHHQMSRTQSGGVDVARMAASGPVATDPMMRPGTAIHGPLPPITVLKPLHGDEPMLEAALESTIRQDYPRFQIVFGVQSPADTAIPIVERLRLRHPNADITLVIDPADHGPNRKIGNLINMFPQTRHDLIVIADSDLHVRPDYLRRIASTLAEPGVGLATVLYTGLPAANSLPARFGATQITHGFLPGAVLARAMGRQDCLGATMALGRDTLARIGGLHALVAHLADDNVLGQRVRALGLRVALAPTIVATTVPETSIRALFRHELRWARTIRALVPGSHAASVLQYPLVWAALAGLFAAWGWGVLALAWAVRAVVARGLDRALAPVRSGPWVSAPIWLLPVRDALSVAVWLVSHAGTWVDWRGQGLHADTPPSA